MVEPLRRDARILYVRMSALGDVLFALEALASLKDERPDVRVDFLIEDRFASLLDGHPQIDQVIVFPRRAKRLWPRALRRLRRERYDVVLDAHGNLKSALHVFAARSKCKVGFAAPVARDGAHYAYDHSVTLPEPMPHRADRAFHLLRAVGLEAGPARPVLPAPIEAVDPWADDGTRRVVIHPGTSAFADFKRWPEDRYHHLAHRLAAAGIQIAVSHGPGEQALAARVIEAAPTALRLDGGDLGLVGLADAFARADVMIAADTGPLHLAAAAGTRCVALFGPKRPEWYGPRGDGHALLYHDVPCRPCRRRRCASPQCVLGIGVDRVERAVLTVLEG